VPISIYHSITLTIKLKKKTEERRDVSPILIGVNMTFLDKHPADRGCLISTLVTALVA